MSSSSTISPPSAKKKLFSRENILQPVRSFQQRIVDRFNEEEAHSFNEVRAEELKEIAHSRRLRGQPAVNNDVTGIAFSGGGIRSATFNLGILQGLAQRGFLRELDHTSTISGGGYIGAWLVSWIRRCGIQNVQSRLATNVQQPPGDEEGRYLEPTQLRALREYSNYLTPRAGLMSTDTWAALAIYERNFILNLVTLLATGLAFLSLPDLLLWLVKSGLVPPASWLKAIIVAAVTFATVVIGFGFGALSAESPARSGWRGHIVNHAGAYTSFPLFLAAIAGTILLGPWFSISGTPSGWILTGALMYLTLWAINWSIEEVSSRGVAPVAVQTRGVFAAFFPPAMTLFVGAFTAAMTYGVSRLFQHDLTKGIWAIMGGETALLVFGPALLVLGVLVAAVFHMGLSGLVFPDAKREWLARAAAILSLLTLGWLVVFGLTFYGPLLMKYLAHGYWAKKTWAKVLKWIVGLSWLSTVLAGVKAGRSPATNGKEATTGGLKLLTKIAPPLFMIGLVLLLSFGLDGLLASFNHRNVTASSYVTAEPSKASTSIQSQDKAQPKSATAQSRAESGKTLPEIATAHWTKVNLYLNSRLLGALVVFLLAMLIFGNRVDVNEFSMHLFYRNRLTRAYLGGSLYGRKPDPFTGFSVQDDILLKDFKTSSLQPRIPIDSFEKIAPDPKPYDGPLPIVGAALNLVRGKELAWQKRKAASFAYTPLFTGYDYFSDKDRAERKNFSRSAYRPTELYGKDGGPHLGTAIAISGAAASPNMGYHTNSALAFLMAVFNVRLGWWTVNPRHLRLWKVRGSPPLGLVYLLREMFPSTNDDMHYLYLSDGGHFENLGIYELVRRQCRFIIACDASCDPDSSFDDLGAAIEKCRRDFGVKIEIDVSELHRDANTRHSTAHFALGTIHYRIPRGRVTGFRKGYLLYIKSSLTGDETEDVQAYAAQHTAFPHDTTANQFFDESQFESYRALGEHVFQRVVAAATPGVGSTQPLPITLRNLFLNLRRIANANRSGMAWRTVSTPLPRNIKLSVRP